MTAAELARRLAADPQYQGRVAAQAQRAAVVLEEERRTLECLATAGYRASSLAELIESPHPLPQGVARVLLDCLDAVETSNVKQMLVRALIRATESFDVSRLARLFERVDDQSLRWAVANTLAEVRAKSLGPWLADAVRNPSYGKAREMLALALARSSDPAVANPILVSLLQDIPGHAALALQDTGGPQELLALKRAQENVQGWERTAIGKAISVIERRVSSQSP